MADQFTYQITYLDGSTTGFVNAKGDSQDEAIKKFEAKFPARTVVACKLLGRSK